MGLQAAGSRTLDGGRPGPAEILILDCAGRRAERLAAWQPGSRYFPNAGVEEGRGKGEGGCTRVTERGLRSNEISLWREISLSPTPTSTTDGGTEPTESGAEHQSRSGPARP